MGIGMGCVSELYHIRSAEETKKRKRGKRREKFCLVGTAISI